MNILKIKINLLNDLFNYKINKSLNESNYNNLIKENLYNNYKINKTELILDNKKIIDFIEDLCNENINVVKIETEYPGGFYYIYINNNQKLKVFAINNDTNKISINDQEEFMWNVLNNIDLNQYKINENKIINFYDFFISLENFRDINNNIIHQLIQNNSLTFEHKKIGSFGFSPLNKPLRIKFIDMCNKHQNKLIYIRTRVYNKNNPKMLSWIDIKNKFKYIIDLPGHTYSTKLYTLLFCKRLIFLVGETRKCMFNWEYKLKPFVHFIPVKGDYSDIIEKYNWAESHPNRVKKIINNAFKFGFEEMHPNKMKNNLINNIFQKIN